MLNALIIYTAGIVTGAVVSIVSMLAILRYINKAFDEDKKDPWRLE